MSTVPGAVATTTQTCYRHPDRETAVQCSNCGRPICPQCMTPTPVGMRCPECAKQKTQVRTMSQISSPSIQVTIGLIIVNAVLFVTSGSFGLTSGGGSALRDQLVLYGPAVADGEWWRLITGGFLHAGIIHILFNMYLLYVLGQMLEPALGKAKFALLYFTALLAGSLGVMLLDPTSVTVGASGAVFGLMGAAFMEMRARGIDPFAGGFLGSIGGLIVLNLVLTFVIGNISIGGHLGGLAGGFLAAGALIAIDRRRLPGWTAYAALGALSVVFAVAAVALSSNLTGVFG